MNNELLTIKQYAQIVGVSTQAVYKQLTTKLSKFVVVVDNKKFLDKAVLTEICQPTDNQVVNNVDNHCNQVDNPIFEKTISLLEKQLEEKDKQINTLLEQVKTLQELLNQAQQLQAMDKKVYLLEKENKKKKGFLWLFSKKETADNE